MIAYCVDGASRMDALIQDLLAYLTAGSASSHRKESTSLESALQAALMGLGKAVAETGAVITHDPLPSLRMLEVHAQQLFQNLIGNALKYRGADPPAVHLSAHRDGHAWILSVQDNGIGIDPAYQAQVFGLFKRLHSASEYAGTGIGLAICKKLVERYGGRIWVESAAGKGSTFSFSIPDTE